MSGSRQREDDYWYWRNREIDVELDQASAKLSAEQDATLSGEGLLAKHGTVDMSNVSSLLDGHLSHRAIERMEAHLRAGRNKEALQGANTELAFDPENARVLTVRAEAHRCLGHLEPAIIDATSALGFGAEGTWAAWAYTIRADARLEQGDADQALADADTALEISPKYPYALAIRGGACVELGRLDDASESVEAALHSSPGFPLAHFVRAVLHVRRGSFGEAVRDATRAMARSNPDPRVLWVRAEAYRRLGRVQEAAQDARKILDLVRAHKGASRLLKKLGETNQISILGPAWEIGS